MSRFAFIVFATVLLAGCQTAQTGVTLPPLPAWIVPSGSTSVPAVVVANETKLRVPNVPVNYSDNTYTVVSEKWLDMYLRWTWEVALIIRPKGQKTLWTKESLDCENITNLFANIAGISAAYSGVNSAPLIANILVQWSPTERHELAGVVTDAGVFIIEPQPEAPQRKWKLEAYEKPILAITYGSYNRPY